MSATHRAESVRKLQRGLYLAAKSNEGRKFYSLYDKAWRQDVLWQAWEDVKSNRGAPGVDAQSIVELPRFRGRVDYAAIFRLKAAISNCEGLT